MCSTVRGRAHVICARKDQIAVSPRNLDLTQPFPRALMFLLPRAEISAGQFSYAWRFLRPELILA